jgi:ribosomal protein S18 acetylase RimI-like enzyme
VPDLRPLSPDDEPAAERLLDDGVGGRRQARLGDVLDVLALPGFGAWEDGRLLGLATYAVDGTRGELAVLVVAADRRGGGIGGRLVEAVWTAVVGLGGRELWLVTTNDNLDALRLYQRHGFRLAALHAGAVDRAREVKPEIALVGDHGIPIHDELVLSRHLT